MGTGCLLFTLINPTAPYWAFGFPTVILNVFGANFIFACGTLFIACIALPHKQSLVGSVFQTVTQLGAVLGLAMSTITHNKVIHRAMGQSSTRAGVLRLRGIGWPGATPWKATTTG